MLEARTFGHLLLVLVGSCSSISTEDAYQQLDRIFGAVEIPPSLELVYTDNEGSFLPWDDSGPPSSLRVYRVRGDALQARSDVIDALGRLGVSRRISPESSRFREDNHECVFVMAGNGLRLHGSLEDRPDQPFGSGPVCPPPDWTEVYLWLTLNVAWDRFT